MYNTQSAIAKLLESMRGGAMQPTPPFNPNAPTDPPQGLLANAPTPEQMLAQQLSQNANRGYMASAGQPPQAPPQAPPSPPVAPPQGLLAGAPNAPAAPGMMAEEPPMQGGRSNLFQPEMDPALAARMNPEDIARATPSVLRSILGAVVGGVSPRQLQRHRAEQILRDRDDATARAKTARDAAAWEEIQRTTAQLPASERLRAVATMASAAGLAQGADASLAAQRLEQDTAAVRPLTHVPVITEGDYRGGRARFKDGVFDIWIERPATEREMTAGEAAAQGRQQRDVGQMRDDFAADVTVRTAKNYASAFQGVVASSRENNPQSNLALMYEAVKMRDPNAVREGELALQRSARSVPGWLYGLWDKASRGNLLTATEREQIVEWARVKVDEQERLVRPIQAEFGARARRLGVQADSSYIAPSPFAGASRTRRAPPPGASR